MNREIKFRVWIEHFKKFESSIKFLPSGAIEVYSTDFREYIPIESRFVRQFTGLLDKNGKEIYEGDIVVASNSDNKYLSTVKWVHNDGQWGFEAIVNEKMPWRYCLSFRCSGWEIVGNVFENPELTTFKP